MTCPCPSCWAQFREDRYRITVAGPVDAAGLGLPDGTQVARQDGNTVLVAPAADRRALYSMLDRPGQLARPWHRWSRLSPTWRTCSSGQPIREPLDHQVAKPATSTRDLASGTCQTARTQDPPSGRTGRQSRRIASTSQMDRYAGRESWRRQAPCIGADRTCMPEGAIVW